MTKEQKIEAIRTACIEVNPRILDLKAGCDFKIKKFKLKREGVAEVESELVNTVVDTNYDFDGERFHVRGIVYIDSGTSAYPTIGERKVSFETFEESDRTGFEIIGRPVRLADVLNVLRVRGDKWYETHNSTTETVKYISLIQEIVCHWNLLQDDLTQQSEPTLDFIYSLLNPQTEI